MKTWKSKLSTTAAALLIGMVGFGTANAAPVVAANGFAKPTATTAAPLIQVRYHGHGGYRSGYRGGYRHRGYRRGYYGHRRYGYYRHRGRYYGDGFWGSGWPLALALTVPFLGAGVGYGDYYGAGYGYGGCPW